MERHQKPEVQWWEVQDGPSAELRAASERALSLARARWLDTRLCRGRPDGEARIKVNLLIRILVNLMVRARRVLKVEA